MASTRDKPEVQGEIDEESSGSEVEETITKSAPKISDDDEEEEESDDESEEKGKDDELERTKEVEQRGEGEQEKEESSDDDDDDSDDGEEQEQEQDKLKDKEKDQEEQEGEQNKEKEGSSSDDDDDDDDDHDDGDDDEQKQDEETEKEKDKEVEEEEEEEEEEDDRPSQPSKVYDFDIMMAKKKEENSRKRRRRGYDIINDNDDFIADIINQMKDAAEGDAEANRSKQAAIRKLKLLPFVMSQLKKIEMRDAFLDSDVLSVMAEWLAPLPDKSLPHLQVREAILKTLIDMNLYDVDRIKGSGIGKAVMYLFKHPKETKENKQRAKQLISCWSRPIFQLESSFNSISREERQERDLELQKKQRRSLDKEQDSDDAGPSQPQPKKLKDDNNVKAQKPGDKGWIPRARVPAPSMRDYVIRPKSLVDGDIGKSSKRPSNMLDKYMKSQQERRRAGRQQRAVNMNIDRG